MQKEDPCFCRGFLQIINLATATIVATAVIAAIVTATVIAATTEETAFTAAAH